MVVFTCSHCGESVKKNQVDKHYQFSCRGKYPALTCVDCLKDFEGNSHIAHTSCFTEEERYSAKGFVPKPPSCKGKKKQENWEQFIRNILESNVKLDSRVKDVLMIVSQTSGVPQKKPKFVNFCKNIFKFRHKTNVFESAWKFLEEKREEHRNNSCNPDGSLDNCQNDNVKQEDRKRKRVDSLNVLVVEDGNDMNDINVTKIEDSECTRKKEKKHKKDKQDMNLDKSSYEEQENPTNTIVESKKEKKVKLKREKYEKQLLEIQSVPVSNDCDGNQISDNSESNIKSKKKKKKRQEISDVKVKEYLETAKNNHKKREKHQDLNIEDIENQDAIIEQGEMQSKVEAPSKFNWEETVVKLLKSKGDLPLKRVEKKVVNEYMNSEVHIESIEKAINKFNKKILKMSRVKVKRDVVKLVS